MMKARMLIRLKPPNSMIERQKCRITLSLVATLNLGFPLVQSSAQCDESRRAVEGFNRPFGDDIFSPETAQNMGIQGPFPALCLLLFGGAEFCDEQAFAYFTPRRRAGLFPVRAGSFDPGRRRSRRHSGLQPRGFRQG